MQNPKKTVRLDITVSEDHAPLIIRYVAQLRALANEQNRLVYELISDNPTMTLTEIQKLLRNKHKIQKRIETLKKLADECGLPYKK
jgi:transposase